MKAFITFMAFAIIDSLCLFACIRVGAKYDEECISCETAKRRGLCGGDCNTCKDA